MNNEANKKKGGRRRIEKKTNLLLFGGIGKVGSDIY